MDDDVTSPVKSDRLEAGTESPPHAVPFGPDTSAAVLDGIAVQGMSCIPALDLKDTSEQGASLKRKTTDNLSAMERLFEVTLEELKETKVALRQADAALAVLTEGLRLQTARGRRLTTRVALLGSELRTKTADAAEARRDRAATLAESHYQIRTLTNRIGALEARLAKADANSTKASGPSPPSENNLRRRKEIEAALMEAQRREKHVRSEHERSRWIKIGRALRLTKL